MKKKIISFLVVFIFIINIIFPTFSLGNQDKLRILNKSEGVKEKQNNLYNSNLEIEENPENYTEEYKRWVGLSKEEKTKYGVIPRKYNVPFDVLYENTSKKETFNQKLLRKSPLLQSSEEIIPEKFDLRDKINIPVRNQKTYGLCWAFASLKSLETNLALNGYGDFDFSEFHLDYLESNEFGTNYELHEGRNFEDFEKYIRNGNGPVLESEAPYDSKYTFDDYEYLYNLKAKVYVNETVNFPTIDKINKEYTLEQINLFRNKVKEHIMKNGSVFASIVSKSVNTDFFSNTIEQYNDKYVLNYQSEFATQFHAISIIGWDDNFSKNNFPESCRPNSNGAYIAINSWGEQWGENGIFYISYEDSYVEQGMSGVISASTEKDGLQKIEFNDANLYNAMKYYLGKSAFECDDSGNIIYTSKLVIDNTKNLNLSNKNISSLKGIEKYYNLTKLDLSNNNLEDINLLENLTNLENLYLNNNNITDITPLSNLTNLYKVVLNNNNISNIEGIINLENLKCMDLSYNKINDISNINDFEYNELIFSGNNINSFPNNTYGAEKIYFDNCDLDDNDVASICENLGILNYLSLRNNNITDLNNITSEYNIGHSTLDVSGNKNIDLDTISKINNISCLILSDCNINDISKIKENYNGFNLDLSKNPINDISGIEDINLYSIDISYTNINSIPNIQYLRKLNISGLGKIQGLSNYRNLVELKMNDCNLNSEDFKEIVENLPGLNTIYVNNNNITNLDEIQIQSISNIYLSNNKITDISGLEINSEIEMLDLSKNQIDNRVISILKKYNYSDVAGIDLSDNNVENFDEIFNNEGAVSRYWPYVKKRIDNTYINKNIEIEKNKDNTIIAPYILWNFFKESINNKNIKFICENCNINSIATKIKLTSNKLGEGQARVVVREENKDMFTYTINYNTVENINVTEILVKKEPNKKYYIEGENIDTTGLIVEIVYENGLKETTDNYTIINGNNLSCQKDVIIKSNKNPETETILPIRVFARDCVVEMNFNDDNICDAIIGCLNEYYRNIIILSYDKNEKIIKIPREEVEKVDQLELSSKNIQDISGLENFINLEIINLSYNRDLSNIESLFSLNKIRNVAINGTNVKDISGLLQKDSVQRISVVNRNEMVYANNNKIELPKKIYQSLTLQENIEKECKVYYNITKTTDNEEYYINEYDPNKDVEIIIDEENQKAVIDLNDVINGYEDLEVVGIDLNILNGKTQNKYTFFYELKCNHKFTNGVCENCGEKILKDDSKYSIEDAKIKGIAPNSTLEMINSSINNDYQIKLLDENKNEVEDGIIKTGRYLRVIKNDIAIEDYSLIVKGDTTGDGNADLHDILSINKHRLNKVNLENEYLNAGDVDGDGVVDIKDILQINKFRLGKINSL